MAAPGAWRKLLNGHPIFDVLRQSREKLPKAKDCKGLLDIRDGELYLWNSYNSNLLTANLKCLGQKTQSDRVTHQTLLCTNAPVFEVEWLLFSQTGAFISLIGQRGVSVLQIPHRSGKYAEFEAGKKKINCKTMAIAERLFLSNSKVRVLHAAWHPGSPTDTHLVLLTSDNHIRIYDLTNPQTAEQTYPLSDASENYSLSASRTTFNIALGETAVAFDFGPKVALEVKTRLGVQKKETEAGIGWPIYILWGNGDIYSLLTSVDDRWPVKSQVQGPLSMHPPAEDNYGTDACSLTCLHTTPPVLVVATCAGKLYHCVALPRPDDDCDSASEVSWNVTDTSALYEVPSEASLYVFESIELELSLTTVTVETDEMIVDDFACPIRLHKDPGCPDRYHCSHTAGVHTVLLPWVHKFQQFLQDENTELPDASSQDHQTVVEHLICTKPLPTSPVSPVLGVCVTNDKLLKPTLLCLTATLECIALPLIPRPRSLPAALLSTSPMKKQDWPLKRLQKEAFDDRVQAMLAKNTSNPLLKGAPSPDLTAQELFQLLSRSTQVFREERIQKLDLVRQEIGRRVRVLTEQRQQQVEDLNHCQEMRNILTENAGNLAERYEDAADRHQSLISRIEAVLRKLQSRCGELSTAEHTMKRDLSDMEVRLKQQKNTLQQLATKQKYQTQQLEHVRKTTGTTSGGGRPPLSKTQMQQLRTVLKDEGDQITDLVKRINMMKGQLQL